LESCLYQAWVSILYSVAIEQFDCMICIKYLPVRGVTEACSNITLGSKMGASRAPFRTVRNDDLSGVSISSRHTFQFKVLSKDVQISALDQNAGLYELENIHNAHIETAILDLLISQSYSR
jgi:hypothetical protein